MSADNVQKARIALDSFHERMEYDVDDYVELRDALIAAVRADEREQAVARFKKLPSDWGQMAEHAIVKAIRNA
jgi:hypothetical protein